MKFISLLVLLGAAASMHGQPASQSTLRPKVDLEAVRSEFKEIRELARIDLKTACEREGRLIDDLLQREPDGQLWASYLRAHLPRLDTLDRAAAARAAERYSESGNEGVRAVGKGWLAIDAMRVEPLKLSFTAVDDREVDLEKLLGKVVLLEFTGVTWCPACRVAEVELKKLHDKFADRGLEIVAITYESGADKRDAVARLVRERQLPWPFSFDGLAHKSPLIERFSIQAFPTCMILDRSGRLVAFNPPHDQLESVIVRQLDQIEGTGQPAGNSGE